MNGIWTDDFSRQFCTILGPSLVIKVIGLLAQSSKITQHSFVDLISSEAYSIEKLESTISMFVSTIARRLARCSDDEYLYDWGILAASRACSLLCSSIFLYSQTSLISLIVTAACRRNLPIALFYCGMIDLLEISELIESYEDWANGNKTFSFFQFPFLISLGRKAEILVHESRVAMDEAARQSRRSYYGNERSYILLTVRRSHIVEDSLRVVRHSFFLRRWIVLSGSL